MKFISIIVKNPKGLFSLFFIVFVVLQILTIINYWGSPQYSDANAYQELATACYKNNEWYPNASQLYNNYIFNPGYVNFLIIQLKIFGTLLYNGIIGLCFNLILLYVIMRLVSKIVNDECAWWSGVLYCLMYSNVTVVVPTMSELLFALLFFSSLLFLSGRNYQICMGTILLCLANSVRPILVIFGPSILLYYLFKKKYIKLSVFVFSFLFSTFLMSHVIRSSTAARDAQGTTMGFNMIMGANDDMNGTVNFKVFSEGHIGYIKDESMDCYQRDSLWRKNAINWIVKNPVKFIFYAPVKLARLWWADDYNDQLLKNVRMDDLACVSESEIIKHAFTISIRSVGYYVIIIFAIVGLYAIRRRLWGYWGIYILPILLACGMHCILYGGMRYHYAYIPIFLLFAGIGILYLKYKNLDFIRQK